MVLKGSIVMSGQKEEERGELSSSAARQIWTLLQQNTMFPLWAILTTC